MKNHVYGGRNFPFVFPANNPYSKYIARIVLVLIVLIPVLIVGGLGALVWWLV